MDFETLELDWLTEIVRSHQEAIQQVDSLPPAERGGLTPLLARRQLVLGSDGFRTLVELMAELVPGYESGSEEAFRRMFEYRAQEIPRVE